MVRFPAPALRRLVDNFQRISLARPHSRGAQQRAQGPHVAPLPANDFTHISLGDFQFDHVVIEMIDEDLIGSINDPLRNLLHESANICSSFSHGFSQWVQSKYDGYATEAAGAAAGLE